MDGKEIKKNTKVEIHGDVLETLLQGEQLAIHAYEKAIGNVKNSELKVQFRTFQEAHKHWLHTLTRIQARDNHDNLSLWSQTMVTGMFTWDRFTSDNVERDSVRHIRDGEELGIKELKKAKHQISTPSGQALLDEMIAEASTRVDLLNQEVDHLRLQ